MNVGTSTSAISIHQKIAASASVPSDGSANPAATQDPASTASAAAKPAKPAAAPAASSDGGSGGASEDPVVAILKEQIARLQKQLATEQKQLGDASKSTPKGGGPNVAASGLQNEIQSTIAALLKATAALATYMSASAGVDVHA
ncbi:MAG TPA: hypothetical protein VGO76_19805 [Luteibacter sp.]|jgi:hypothetical protein|nr:hypothetical protein [Luteibacter sp.]